MEDHRTANGASTQRTDAPQETPPSSEAPDKEEFVRSLANGLKVLESFAEAEDPMTLSDVARRTGLSRAAARRMLKTLVHLDYASTDGRLFVLTPKVLSLGVGFWSGNGLHEVLQPLLRSLAAELNESCSASVLVGDEVVYIARAHTRRIMRMDLDIGTRLPAFATSMGRVLLGGLDPAERRRLLETADRPALTPVTRTGVDELLAIIESAVDQGWTLVDQELETGLRSVSAPVEHPDRGVVAAINVSVSAGLETPEQTRDRVLPPLRRAAEEAGRSVAAWERSTGRPVQR